MRYRYVAAFAFMSSLLLSLFLFAARQEPAYFLVEIDQLGFDKVDALKHAPGVQWWVEAADKLLIYGTLGKTEQKLTRFRKIDVSPAPERLFLVKRAHSLDLSGMDADVIVDAGRSAIIQTRTAGVPELPVHNHPKDVARADYAHAILRIFEPNLVLSRQARNEAATNKRSVKFAESVDEMVAKVDGDRWLNDVTHLNTLNRFVRNPGNLAARDWFKAQFEALPNTEVSLFEFTMQGTRAYNVVAKMTGTERPDEWYVVGGHYDSTSQSTSTAAPGAEDNGSGSAGVLEMARIFAEHPPKATVFFMVYSGEEQGLFGSEAHVAHIIATGEKAKLKGMINMDMIGYAADREKLAVTLETERVATSLLDTLKASAARYSAMTVNTSFDAWGSDHVPYLQKQIPAVLTIDNDWSRYPDYHRTTDLVDRIVKNMGVEILKMNVGALAQVAGAD